MILTLRPQRIYIISALLLVLGMLPFFAHAFTVEKLQDIEVRNDFVLGPGKAEFTLSPGERSTKELIVTNRTGHDIFFEIEVEDFVGSRDPETATVLLGDERGPYSLQDYVFIERTSFILGHGERARIPVTVTVPINAEPGGLYGSVLFAAQSVPGSPEEEAELIQSGTKIVTRIGALFFVRVQGDVVEDGTLTHFDTLGGSVFSSTPISFQLLFENNGSVHLNPYGQITITDMFGTEVDRIVVDPWFAMPDSLRFREVRWGTSALFGRYTARAEINRGYQDIIDEAETVFWVIPLKPSLVGLLIIIVIVFAIRRRRRRRELYE